MVVSAVLFVAMLVLFAVGVYLLLDRSLTRVLLGFLLVGNGTNLLLFLMSNGFGAAPFASAGADAAADGAEGVADAAAGAAAASDAASSAQQISDPLPQAFILTSIVITFAVSAFILALIYRSWMLARAAEDEVSDDEHDLQLAEAEHLSTDEVTGAELASTVDDDAAEGQHPSLRREEGAA